MNFVFTRRFLILLSLGFVPLSLSWNFPFLRQITIVYDVLLFLAALYDAFQSKLSDEVKFSRHFIKRFAIGDENEVFLRVENNSVNDYEFYLKDEFPPKMKLTGKREGEVPGRAQSVSELVYKLTPPTRGLYYFGSINVRWLSRWGLVWRQKSFERAESVKVYPNARRAREMELTALGARSLTASRRRSILRGEGRDFESLRDYVRGDELRHISWTATAKRGKLVTRQYQVERDQTILIAVDAGRLMTGRIETESKFDLAVHAAIALMSSAVRGGDNVGILTFSRRITKFIPPKKGFDLIDATLEALHDVEPEMVEPSYARALQFIASNLKKRALVIILTDIIDEEGSKDLIHALKLLRPRHLPLVVTIGDTDLRAAVNEIPTDEKLLFTQSVAEEILDQREKALRFVESQGGLALDVNASTLAPALLESYLRIKEKGLL